jgi:predicted HTH domain antitoxin
MKTLTLTLPDSVDVEKSDVMKIIAARLYERRTLSLSEAAKLAKMPKWDFARILSDYGVAYFNQSRGELEVEVKNA